MPLRRAGVSNYYFVWRRQIQPGGNPQLLSQFKSDPSAMHDLRLVLAEAFPGISLTVLSDDQVLAGIARLAGSGELVLAREEARHGGSATQSADSQQTETPAASPPASSSSKAPPESQTLPSNTNAAAQAAALVAAAATGAAVCPH